MGGDYQEQKYVAISDFEGAFVGTFSEIEEWMQEISVSILECEFYELGSKVKVGLGIKK
jgi:hypothetical protein